MYVVRCNDVIMLPVTSNLRKRYPPTTHDVTTASISTTGSATWRYIWHAFAQTVPCEHALPPGSQRAPAARTARWVQGRGGCSDKRWKRLSDVRLWITGNHKRPLKTEKLIQDWRTSQEDHAPPLVLWKISVKIVIHGLAHLSNLRCIYLLFHPPPASAHLLIHVQIYKWKQPISIHLPPPENRFSTTSLIWLPPLWNPSSSWLAEHRESGRGGVL